MPAEDLRDTPFVLFDDAREDSAGIRLFRRPSAVIETRKAGDVEHCLKKLARAHGKRRLLAGFMAYEAGHALEPKLAPFAADAPQDAPPLLWFGIFDEAQSLEEERLRELLGDPASAWAGTPAPDIARAEYIAGVDRIIEHIRAGDIYQANYTFKAHLPVAGDPLALYAGLRRSASAGHGGVVWTGEHWLLSLSPELFFSLEAGRIETRPMKGTAARLADPRDDRAAVEALAADPKERAENLMITDLLRNDLSRVAASGSVNVPALFTVESYPTIHQMTSTVTARLAEGRSAVDVLRTIFPCGSITGAPKIRAMEILEELESAPRGPYTGSIGWIAGDGAYFNVAIRTLVLPGGGDRAVLGLGSGIVADSRPEAEWNECLAKSAFVTRDRVEFDLIETMRFEPDRGILLLDRHIERLADSARKLDFSFDHHAARNELQAASFYLRGPAAVRLRLARSGRLAIETRPLPEMPSTPVAVAVAPRKAAAEDYRLLHKTTRREIYDSAMREGAFETLLEDDEGFLTEGCFTNLFVERDGAMVTPPASRGLLPGALRAELLSSGEAVEGDLTRADLADGFLLGNALRGLIAAKLA